MTDYEKMKLAEKYDEDCDCIEDEEDLERAEGCESEAEAFKHRYKEFYTDIKLSHKEDW